MPPQSLLSTILLPQLLLSTILPPQLLLCTILPPQLILSAILPPQLLLSTILPPQLLLSTIFAITVNPVYNFATAVTRLQFYHQSYSCLQFLAATKQLYDWFSPSVCPSVTPFSPCSHHRIIMKFSGVITNDKSDVHAKGQGQRSKVKVTEVNTQLNRFRNVTPVWIHIWWWNDAYSLMMLRRGALLFFKVIRQISRSHSSKKRRIWPRLGVSGL